MKPHEPAPLANQDVGRNATEQFSGDWDSHLIEFGGPSFLEYDRVRVAQPLVVSTRWALVLGSGFVKCLAHPVKVVLSAVPFHDGSLPAPEGQREGKS
jgi:hypothetical protein